MNKFRDQLLVAIAVIGVMYFAKPLLVPLAYSLFLAMVLHPLVVRMERWGVPRALAITAGLGAVALLFCTFILLLVLQINAFLHDLPELRERSAGVVTSVVEWVQRATSHFPKASTDGWEGLLTGLPKGLASMFAWIMNVVFGVVFNLVIIPVITALLLFDRKRYVQVLLEFSGPILRPVLPDVLQRSVRGFARFIAGLVKVYAIVAALNSIGLLLLGVENAILFGTLSALMTIIPYVGIAVSSLLPMSVVWIATGNALYPLGVVAVYTVVQYLEANLIFPKVVGEQLKMNTLASIVIVLAGGLLWGVAGMILLLPFAAILKIISSEVPSMRRIELLLGNEPVGAVPPSG